MNGRKRLLARLAMVSFLAIAMAACDNEGTTEEGGGDDTWLFHLGGVVCKGADAERVAGTRVYVATGGDDENDGDSPEDAFATLGTALCNAAPGQTVYVAPGTYNESVLLSEFGQKDNPIHVIGQVGQGGELPILDGGGTLTYGIAIIGEDAAHKSCGFVLENLEFRNYTDAGIIAVLSEDIEVRDCIFFAATGSARPTLRMWVKVSERIL